ncbi:MAG: HNH endonuclease [Lentisphaeria bacterium]|nr:HNH endonuclease [Lentisphaeria bacterium]
MSEAALNHRVLVLNKHWAPLDTQSVWEALKNVIANRALIVDNSYQVYNFDEWVSSWSEAQNLAEVAENQIVHSIQTSFKIPEVIIHKNYSGFFVRRARLSRNAIFMRDQYTCQYCNKKFPKSELNIDHVLPRAQGGTNTWTNLVLSCIKCNSSKGNRTPEQAGMKLLKEPKEPHWSMFKNYQTRKSIPQSWEGFFGKMYWDAELTED